MPKNRIFKINDGTETKEVEAMSFKKAVKSFQDVRGHHGHRWDYEPGENYMGMKKSNYWKRNHKVK